MKYKLFWSYILYITFFLPNPNPEPRTPNPEPYPLPPTPTAQEAERRVPINYASQYQSTSGFRLGNSAFLPFKVNATGVMPVIFSSSLLAAPGALARFSGNEALLGAAEAMSPAGSLYLPVNILLIVLFNYYYTFLQLEPEDVAEQLKRQGAR